MLNFAKTFMEANPNNNKLHFLLVTAVNSDANSFFLYPKTKGQLEQGIAEMGFDKVSIFR